MSLARTHLVSPPPGPPSPGAVADDAARRLATLGLVHDEGNATPRDAAPLRSVGMVARGSEGSGSGRPASRAGTGRDGQEVIDRLIMLQRRNNDGKAAGERRDRDSRAGSSSTTSGVPLYRPTSGATSASRRTRESAGPSDAGASTGPSDRRPSIAESRKLGRTMSGTTLASSSSSGPGGLITHSEWEEAQALAQERAAEKLSVDVNEWNGVRERLEYRAGPGSTRSGGTGGTGGTGSRAPNRRRVRYADDKVFEDEDDEDEDDAAFDRERGMGKDPGRDAALSRVRSHGSGTLFDEGRSQGASSAGFDEHRGNRSQISGSSRRDRDASNDRDRRVERAFGVAKMDVHDDEERSISQQGGRVPRPRLVMTPAAPGAVPVFRGTNRYGARNPPPGSSPSAASNTVNGHPAQSAKQPIPARQLFDPHLHDPVRFSHSPSVSTGNSGTTGTHTSRTAGSSALGAHSTFPGAIGTQRHTSSLATSVSLEPSPNIARDREREKDREREPRDRGGGGGHQGNRQRGNEDEEGDRERERRRRKEGSERGSQQHRHRRDGEDRSRGSRSSEGSESLKDRERGRGKGDTGIISRLREAYKGILALESNLTEMHRKMSLDPQSGIKVLINAGLLGQGVTTAAANIAGTGGSGHSFNPVQENGAVGVIKQAMEDEEDEFSRGPVQPRQSRPTMSGMSAEAIEDEAWVELVARHKKLAHAHHDFLALSLDPLVPASHHNLPTRYNLPTRLWQTAFHLILERLRYTWVANAPSTAPQNGAAARISVRDTRTSAKVLDHLTDFIYDAYSFYTSLLHDETLANFQTAWFEALGDLARYRMAVATLTAAFEKQIAKTKVPVIPQAEKLGRIDDDDQQSNAAPFPSGASIGAEVADSWDVEDRETWRVTAREWYVKGIGEKPGEGRLHHHLGMLCRDIRGEEGKTLYHFVKSLTASHPYQSTRESILPLFDTALQHKRATPDANASDLFVLLHGMLFTRIELDEFDNVFDRFMERLEEDRRASQDETFVATRRPIPQLEWLTMAMVNVGALFQYGSDDSILHKAVSEDAAARKASKAASLNPQPQALMVHRHDNAEAEDTATLAETATSGDDKGEGGAGPALRKLAISPEIDLGDPETLPLPLRHALRLSFAMFEFCLKAPVRQSGLSSMLNPYITVFLTFLSVVLKQSGGLLLLERFMPWHALIDFFNSIPRKVDVTASVPAKLAGGPPLPEDWCLRGLEWHSRKLYERGFWKSKSGHGGGGRGSSGPIQPRSGPRIQSEMDVLLDDQDVTHADVVDGIVDDNDGADNTDSPSAITQRRWRRVAWSAGIMAGCVPGLSFSSPTSRKLGVDIGGPLDRKINAWEQDKARKAQEEAARRRKEEEARGEWAQEVPEAQWWDPPLDSDDEDDPELRELQARRRFLRNLLHANSQGAPVSKPVVPPPAPKRQTAKAAVLAGYTVLVFDTNVLLSSLELFQQVVTGGLWTVVVPLPVITELDGLARNPAPLGPAAAEAISYLESHVRLSALSLKVQTSKGNYLSDLIIRSENLYDDVKSSGGDDAETARAHTMDDFILRVAAFQQAHFVDRSNLLGIKMNLAWEEKKKTALKVSLLTFDRNLRLRARARGVDAADEKTMARILGSGG